MKSLKELQERAIELFRADVTAMASATKAKKTAATNFTNAQKEIEAADAAFMLAETGPSAKEMGKAFIAVREACKGMGGELHERGHSIEGGRAWTTFMKKFEESRNRVNYCIRVAEGKVGKEASAARAAEVAKRKPHLKVIKDVASDLNILVRYAARFDRKNGDKLVELIIADIRKLYEETYTRAQKMNQEHKALREEAEKHRRAAKQADLAARKKSREARTVYKAVPFEVEDQRPQATAAGA